VVLAGGTESMSQAPHVVRGARWGLRLGPPAQLEDTLWEALRDPSCGLSMAETAENLATRYRIGRQAVDCYAVRSQAAAAAAWGSGAMAEEVVPVSIRNRKTGQDESWAADECSPLDTGEGSPPATQECWAAIERKLRSRAAHTPCQLRSVCAAEAQARAHPPSSDFPRRFPERAARAASKKADFQSSVPVPAGASPAGPEKKLACSPHGFTQRERPELDSATATAGGGSGGLALDHSTMYAAPLGAILFSARGSASTAGLLQGFFFRASERSD